jgi:DNA-binding GntR family transcriptional regulator
VVRASRPIPSKSTLIQAYGVGAHTVDRAVDVLCAGGMLETVHGKGLYVRR